MSYLKRLSDNVTVKATIKEIKYSKSEFKNWLFDWSKTEKKGYKILALYVENDNRIQGAISIKANPQNMSIEVDIVESEFMAKTNLIEYYKKELGASLIGSQRMIIETISSKKLVDKYCGGVEL